MAALVLLDPTRGGEHAWGLVATRPKLGFHCRPGESGLHRKVAVFTPLGGEYLRRILDLELEMVRQRVQTATAGRPFAMSISGSAREFLLSEGSNSRYGARHLKLAIERLLVRPLSNLMATGQIGRGDHVRAGHSEGSSTLFFTVEGSAEMGRFTDLAA